MDDRIGSAARGQARQALHVAPPANDDLATSMRHMSVASTTSSPLSSAPPTPGLDPTRRPAHPATSPMQAQQHANSPLPPKLRRTSSAMSLGTQRPTSSPKLVRKGSRQSLGTQAEEAEKRPTPKRSISNLIANLREAQSTMESIEEPVPLTAASIAAEHFARELLTHGEEDATAETVVILHDACYGHRYSRLKTTKSTLSMIVERPERIHASVLGASAAYVRMGNHHAGAKNAPHPERRQACPPPFKIRRTARALDITSSYVTSVHGTAWMAELRDMCNRAGDRLSAGTKELGRSSTPTEPEKRKLHEGDLYLSPESLNAFQGALGGVADAVDTIFQPGSKTNRAFVAIRPPGHHCSADFPSGFCWLNNVHVGIEYAAQTYGLTHAAILDFDLHHGDGSQAITWERNKANNHKRERLRAKPNTKLTLGPDLGYYSLHDINSYPCEMGDDDKVQAASLCVENAHGQAVWNVHLQEWKTEDEFWELYETRYKVLLEKARGFLRHHTARLRTEGKVQPKAAVFISAGFDASEWEGAGMQRHKVNVPTEFYARFTRDVVHLAQEEGTACDGRVVSVLEGGYSDRALCSGVLSHLSGLCASPVDAAAEKDDASRDAGLDEMMGGLRLNDISHSTQLHYDKSWWSAANLTALELEINPPPPPQGKRVRTGPQPTYATPTESFAYKVIDPAKFARSISGTMRELPMPVVRPPTPPAPEVNWVVATQELSKLLIPTGRQTRSCTAEELGGTRTKRERQSAAPVLVTAEEVGKPRQLRDRKAKVPEAGSSPYPESAHSDELESVRSVSRSSNSNRRQTFHGEVPAASSAKEPPGPGQQQRRMSRRSSAGSAFGSMDGILEGNAPPVPAIPAMPTNSMTVTATNGAMRPPPVPAAPSRTGGDGVQLKKTRAQGLPAGNSDSAHDPAPPSTTEGAGGVDALTSGMKKINLKVGTREEHDQRQQERAAAERRARALRGAETRRVNAAARKKAALMMQGNGIDTAGLQQEPMEPAAAMQQRRQPGTSEVSLPVPVQLDNSSREPNEQHLPPALVSEAPQSSLAEDLLLSEATMTGDQATQPQAPTVEAEMRVIPAPPQFDTWEPDELPPSLLSDAKAGGVLPPRQQQHVGDLASSLAEAVPDNGSDDVHADGKARPDAGCMTLSPDDAQLGACADGSSGVNEAQPPAQEPSIHAAINGLVAMEHRHHTIDQPSSPASNKKALPPPVKVPDSAARQLIHENELAHGTAPRRQGGGNTFFSSPTPRSPSHNKESKPLPSFSATGPIPFAQATASPIARTSMQQQPSSNKSPPKSSSSSSRLWRKRMSVSGEHVGDGNGVSRTMLEGHLDEVVGGTTPEFERREEDVVGGFGSEAQQGQAGAGEEEGSVWDVPKTPQK